MNIKLLQNTPLKTVITAIRCCWNSEDDSDSVTKNYFSLGVKDKNLIQKIIANGHTSTLEHLTYSFLIDGVSRACLQEVARHRIAGLSVQSSRYTLKKLLKATAGDELKRYLVPSGHPAIDKLALRHLKELHEVVTEYDIPNDQAKYALPESFVTRYVWSFNARSLRNLLALRTSPRALVEFQRLANGLFEKLPDDHKFIFEDVVAA